MRRIVAILSLALLAACHPGPKPGGTAKTTVTQETKASGMVTRNALEFTAYAIRPTLGNNTTTGAYVDAVHGTRANLALRLSGEASGAAAYVQHGFAGLQARGRKDLLPERPLTASRQKPNRDVIAPRRVQHQAGKLSHPARARQLSFVFGHLLETGQVFDFEISLERR